MNYSSIFLVPSWSCSTPLYPPQSVASQGAHPTPSPFIVHLWTRSWIYQGAWGCVNIIEKHLWWQNIVQRLYKILNECYSHPLHYIKKIVLYVWFLIIFTINQIDLKKCLYNDLKCFLQNPHMNQEDVLKQLVKYNFPYNILLFSTKKSKKSCNNYYYHHINYLAI